MTPREQVHTLHGWFRGEIWPPSGISLSSNIQLNLQLDAAPGRTVAATVATTDRDDPLLLLLASAMAAAAASDADVGQTHSKCPCVLTHRAVG